jgi:hypothetical protein
MQNGSSAQTGIDPDGFALVDPSGAVVEFLSYEGSFTAAAPPAGGPAAGLTSLDVGIRESGEPVSPRVSSLSRDAGGVWSGPALNTFGACTTPARRCRPPRPRA